MRTTMSCHEMHFFSLQILWNFSIVGFCTWNALTLWNLVGLFWGKISLKTFRIRPRKVIKNICTFYHVRFQFFVKCTWRSLQLIVVLSKKNCCFLFSLFIEVNAVRKKTSAPSDNDRDDENYHDKFRSQSSNAFWTGAENQTFIILLFVLFDIYFWGREVTV